MCVDRAFVMALPQRALMALVRGYRFFLSPWLGNACRFEPTCSAYSLQALELHGAMSGTYMTLHRLARCHSFCRGGYDPVPARASPLFGLSSDGPPHSAASSPSHSPTDQTSP